MWKVEKWEMRSGEVGKVWECGGGRREYVSPEYNSKMRKTSRNRNTYSFENLMLVKSEFE